MSERSIGEKDCGQHAAAECAIEPQVMTQGAPGQESNQHIGLEGGSSGPGLTEDLGLNPEALDALWQSHYEQFQNVGEADDLDKSIEYGTRALDLTLERDPGAAVRHTNLGISYTERFHRLGNVADLDKAVEHDALALALTPNDHPELAKRHANLGISFGDRFQCLGEPEDNNKSIEHYGRALELTPEGDSDSASRHASLGVSYTDRFQLLDDPDDLQKSIEHRIHALALTPENHPDLATRHADLGISFGNRFQRLGELKDNDKSIEQYARALELTPHDHPHLASRHADLGVSYTDRFRRLGNFIDFEKSMEHKIRALELTPDGHPHLAKRHANLGVSYGNRFQQLGDLQDNEKSIAHYSRALELTPDGHRDSASRHSGVGISYTDRFRRLGDLNDLEKSIDHKIRALELTPRGHPDLPRRHTNLGISYTDRFGRLGNLDDLEKSIEHKICALKLTPNDHPDLANRHTDLGVSFDNRFQRLGELEDSDKSIEHHYLGLDLTPRDHPHLASRYASLGISYANRFQRLGDLEDLQKSIEHRVHALKLTPDGHPDQASRHTHLGISYGYRFRRQGELEDNEKSIEHHSRALALTPEGHPDLASRHASLGVSYTNRFQRLNHPDDLQNIIKHQSHALALTPDNHPSLPQQHFNRAVTLCFQYEHTGDPLYLTQSQESFRTASQMVAGSARDKFRYALGWARRTSQYADLGCIEAYQTTIDLLPQFIWLGASTNQRYFDLSTTESLAVNAASTAIRHSDLNLALEWLEHARCVVWNQSLMLRSPLDELEASHPDLAARLQAVSTQLNNVDSESSENKTQTLTSGSADSERVAHDRRRLAQEYHDLIAQARKLPTFETFLQPLRSERLVHAARNGPIITINCHRDHCDALIILPEQVQVKHLPLPNFSQEIAQKARSELESSLRRRAVRDRGVKVLEQPEYKDTIDTVLLTLWNDVVKPVLEFLGYMDSDSAEILPHITWCPTGALSFLPLHAAGDYDQPRSRVYNHVISSYTPTLTALLTPASGPSNSSPRLLAIGQSNTPGQTPLLGTSTELACIQAHTQNKFEYSQLINTQATTSAVLDAMEQHDWVHLACHAHQNVTDPTQSGFFLHDGTLDLTSINRRSFKNKGLAFLSACQTATGDERLPDEAVHLASGMLMAGYPSVIATMWSVRDKDAPLVADRVYAELTKDGKVGNGEAGKALHKAVGVLRDKVGEKEFARWVPYIHIGS